MIDWVLLAAVFVCSSLAMFLGIGAAPLLLAFFLIAYQLPLSAALSATLVLKVFIVIVGILSYKRQQAIAYRLAGQVLFVGVPAVIVGVVLSHALPVLVSLWVFSALLVVFAILILHPEHEMLFRREDAPQEGIIRSEYGLAHNLEVVAATFGGLFTGLVSSGAGEINNYVFLKKYRMHGALATGTSVFIVGVLSLVAAVAHSAYLFSLDAQLVAELAQMLVFAAPVGIIGAFVGSQLTRFIPDRLRELFVSSTFIAIGVLTAVAAFSIGV